MAIKYKVVSKSPRGMAGDHPPKYYPVLTGRESRDLAYICERISERSTFSRADVTGVVQSFIELVPELLLDGKSVKLDGFGIFSVHASGEGKDSPEQITARDITGLKISFLPDKNIKRRLEGAVFEKAEG